MRQRLIAAARRLVLRDVMTVVCALGVWACAAGGNYLAAVWAFAAFCAAQGWPDTRP